MFGKETSGLIDPNRLRGLLCKGLFALTLLTMTILSVGCPVSGDSKNDSDQLLVLSASNLSAVLPEIAAAFTRDTGTRVNFSFGSSGQLSQQIIQGGRADVYISADRGFVDDVLSEGRAFEDSRRVFALVQLVMWWRDDLGVNAPDDLSDLEGEQYKRIAISNPNHAPTGIAAKAALQEVGVWDKIEARLVFGESATQTIQFARSGNTEVAVVPKSLAVQEADGAFTLVSSDLYELLEQEAVVLQDSKMPGKATEFVEYLSSSEAEQLLSASGFEVAAVIPSD